MRSEKDQALRSSAVSLPPIKYSTESQMTPNKKESKMVRIASGPVQQKDLSILTGAEEYNRPERIMRPVEFTDLPMYEDHVGPVRPHFNNMSEKQK